MADNTTITPGTGATVAADLIGGALYQRVKPTIGADGTATDVAAGAGAVGADVQRVTLASDDPLVAGVASFTKAEDAAHSTGDKGIMALSKRTDTAASSAGTDGDYATLCTDANGKLWTHDSATATLAGAVFAEDAASTTADPGVQVLTVRANTAAATSGTDGDYQPLITDTNGRLHVIEPSATTLATAVYAEDLASQSADPGIQILTVRKNTAAATSGTDGDYQPLITDTNGRLHVKDPDAATVALAVFAEDAAASSADKGIQILAVRQASATDLSAGNTDGDYEPLQVDANGRLHAVLSSVTYAEDAAHTTADPGIFILGKRTDTPAASSGTTGDYSTINQDAAGRLWVRDPADVVTVTPVVSASPDYSIGDAVGPIQTIAGASIVSAQPTVLLSISIVDKAQVAPQFDILFFDSSPDAATVTDNAAFALSTDVTKLIGRVRVATADWANIDTVDVASLKNIKLALKPTATSLFAVVVAVATINLAGTSDLIFKYGFEQK